MAINNLKGSCYLFKHCYSSNIILRRLLMLHLLSTDICRRNFWGINIYHQKRFEIQIKKASWCQVQINKFIYYPTRYGKSIATTHKLKHILHFAYLNLIFIAPNCRYSSCKRFFTTISYWICNDIQFYYIFLYVAGSNQTSLLAW